jgi:hypothetical protein
VAFHAACAHSKAEANDRPGGDDLRQQEVTGSEAAALVEETDSGETSGDKDEGSQPGSQIDLNQHS